MSCIIGTLVLCAAQVLWVPPLRGGTQWGILAAAPEWAPEVELGTLATEQGSAVSQWTESCSRHPWADPAIIPCSGGRCRGCCWCLPVIPLLLHASPVPAWTHHVFVVRDVRVLVRVLVRAAVIHLRIILPVIKLASGVSAISSLCLLVLVFLDLCLILLDLVCFWTVDIWLLVVGFVCLFGLPTPVLTFASSPSHKLYSFFVCVYIFELHQLLLDCLHLQQIQFPVFLVEILWQYKLASHGPSRLFSWWTLWPDIRSPAVKDFLKMATCKEHSEASAVGLSLCFVPPASRLDCLAWV